jgi:hypothetical protein
VNFVPFVVKENSQPAIRNRRTMVIGRLKFGSLAETLTTPSRKNPQSAILLRRSLVNILLAATDDSGLPTAAQRSSVLGPRSTVVRHFYRHHYPESTAFPFFALHFDTAAVAFDDLLALKKTDP